MASVAQGQSVNAGNPVLTFHHVLTGTAVAAQATGPTAAGVGNAGTLVAPYALEWSVYDVSTDEKLLAPVLTSGPTSVDFAADRVATGVFAADWDVPANEPLGRHEIRWTWRATAASPALTCRREFDVLRGIAGLRQAGYALVSDLRREGIGADKADDVQVQLKIEQWSRYVETICRRPFEPRVMTFQVDGFHSTSCTLRLPIVGVSDVSAVDDAGVPQPIDLTALRFYNRHLTQGLLVPDDRDAPRIEFVRLQPILIGMSNAYYPAQSFRTGRFAPGTMNVQVTGSFGYTEPDGSPSGDTPALLRRAVQLLVLRDLPKLGRHNDRFDRLHRHRITNESTQGQSYSLASPRAGTGPITGDDEIDSLLVQFMAPIALASTS